MHTNDHFLLPRCTGMNCGATDANHSPECRAEHAAAVAGGRFVKDAAPIAPRAAEQPKQYERHDPDNATAPFLSFIPDPKRDELIGALLASLERSDQRETDFYMVRSFIGGLGLLAAQFAPRADADTAGEYESALNFGCYLIDHCEGETVREESILTWLGKMLSDPQYTAQQAECAPRVDDLSALVARLARALRKAAPENDLSGKALDYLKREGLEGSPLRAECAPREAQPVACPNCGGGPVTWKCMCEPMWRPTPERADADTAGAKLLGPADEGFWSKPNSAAGASERADAEKDAELTDTQIREIWLRETGFDEQAAPFAILEFARAILAAKEKKS
jgi:hypothetical protein